MKVILILNGEVCDYDVISRHVDKTDFIIACDGGIKHCKEMDIIPNIIIGDFDSVDEDLLEIFRGKTIALRFPVEKDFTDGELGVRKAIQVCEENDWDEVVVLGGFSHNGRFDHVLANIFMLKLFDEKNIKSSLVCEKNEVFYLTKDIKLKTNKKFLSLIPLTEVLEIESSTGLKYSLNNEVFNFGSSRSLSNECEEEEISIIIKSGKAVLTLSND